MNIIIIIDSKKILYSSTQDYNKIKAARLMHEEKTGYDVLEYKIITSAPSSDFEIELPHSTYIIK